MVSIDLHWNLFCHCLDIIMSSLWTSLHIYHLLPRLVYQSYLRTVCTVHFQFRENWFLLHSKDHTSSITIFKLFYLNFPKPYSWCEFFTQKQTGQIPIRYNVPAYFFAFLILDSLTLKTLKWSTTWRSLHVSNYNRELCSKLLHNTGKYIWKMSWYLLYS